MASKSKFFSALLVVSVCAGCAHLKMGMFVLKSNPRMNVHDSIALGRSAFASHCSGCHGSKADGMGELAGTLSTPPTNFRALAYSKSATRIAGHIAYGKGRDMPAFVDELPEERIWDIANFLHSLQKNESN